MQILLVFHFKTLFVLSVFWFNWTWFNSSVLGVMIHSVSRNLPGVTCWNTTCVLLLVFCFLLTSSLFCWCQQLCTFLISCFNCCWMTGSSQTGQVSRSGSHRAVCRRKEDWVRLNVTTLLHCSWNTVWHNEKKVVVVPPEKTQILPQLHPHWGPDRQN